MNVNPWQGQRWHQDGVQIKEICYYDNELKEDCRVNWWHGHDRWRWDLNNGLQIHGGFRMHYGTK